MQASPRTSGSRRSASSAKASSWSECCDCRSRRACSAVVLTGPFTGVKDQVVGTYAARLHERGLTTLAFDHRGFGESGGRRAHEDSQGKLADLRAAVSRLAAHPAVEAARVGGCRDMSRRWLRGARGGQRPENPRGRRHRGRVQQPRPLPRRRSGRLSPSGRLLHRALRRRLPAVAPDGGDGGNGRRRAVRLLRHRAFRGGALGEPGDLRLAARAHDVRRARRGAVARRHPAVWSCTAGPTPTARRNSPSRSTPTRQDRRRFAGSTPTSTSISTTWSRTSPRPPTRPRPSCTAGCRRTSGWSWCRPARTAPCTSGTSPPTPRGGAFHRRPHETVRCLVISA